MDGNKPGLVGQGVLDGTFRSLMLGHSSKALGEMHNFAEQGSLLAMIYLGLAYQKGICTKRNYKEAERWYQRAAELGLLEGHYHLGRLYLDRKQYKDAERSFGIAADKRSPKALFQLGRMYLFSVGVKQDVDKARAYLEASLALNYAYAKRELGLLLTIYGKNLQERWRGIGMYFTAKRQISRKRKNVDRPVP